MNLNLVKELILKDWYLQRGPILISLFGSVVAVAITITGGKPGFMLGLIALVTILIGFGANLAMATIVNERKEQTLPFVMSLPISFREYTASKILGNLLIFLVPWSAIGLAVGALFLLLPPSGPSGVPHGLIPYVAIMLTEMLVSTTLVASVAITTESQRWTIGMIMVGNLAFNGFGYLVAHADSMARSMWSPAMQWTPTAVGLVVAEFAAIALMLSLTFAIQSRKKDFL